MKQERKTFSSLSSVVSEIQEMQKEDFRTIFLDILENLLKTTFEKKDFRYTW